MQAARYKLGLLAGKKRFTHMPEQLDDETYGTISGAFGKDVQRPAMLSGLSDDRRSRFWAMSTCPAKCTVRVLR